MENISYETILSIQRKLNIVDVISEYLPLEQKGKNYFGVCPFHNDTNPSMSVSREKQIYKCFSCGASGNVFNFIMDYDHIDFNGDDALFIHFASSLFRLATPNIYLYHAPIELFWHRLDACFFHPIHTFLLASIGCSLHLILLFLHSPRLILSLA